MQYFFVLTGFLVRKSMMDCYNNYTFSRVIQKSWRRYLRLLPVVFLATLFTWFTMKTGMQYHLKIVDQVANGGFLANYCNFEVTGKNLIANAFLLPFIKGSEYVNPFWTIKYELWGYIFCMLTCFATKNCKLRRAIYIIVGGAITVLLSSNYLPFFMGLFMADVYFDNDRNATVFSKLYWRVINTKTVIAFLLVFGLVLASYPTYVLQQSVYRLISFLPESIVRSLGISLLLYSLLHFRRLQMVFEWKPLRWVGEISFEVYAFHWPIMLTVQARVFAYLANRTSYDTAAVISFIVTLPVIIAISYGVHWLIKYCGSVKTAK